MTRGSTPAMTRAPAAPSGRERLLPSTSHVEIGWFTRLRFRPTKLTVSSHEVLDEYGQKNPHHSVG